jgi:hypothetical protein
MKKPSKRVPTLGVGLLAVSTVVGGIVLGVISAAIAQYFYLVLVMPVGMGFLGFIIVLYVSEKTRLRDVSVFVVSGALIGVLAYDVYHYSEYLLFRHKQEEALSSRYDDLSKQEIAQRLDLFLEEETGTRGFLGYLRWTSRDGVTLYTDTDYAVMETGGPATGLTISSRWVWLYRLAETLIAGETGAALTSQISRRPFCVQCGQRYPMAELTGSVPSPLADRFLALLETGDLSQAAEFVCRASRAGEQRLNVRVHKCPNCPDSDIVLLVERPSAPKHRKSPSRVFEGLITSEEYATLSGKLPPDTLTTVAQT